MNKQDLTLLRLDVAFAIRNAVCRISEKRPSIERCMIDQFLRHISPSMKNGRGIDFPKSCRRHPNHSERAGEGGSNAALLYFHIGNSILGFYDICRDDLLTAFPADVIARLEETVTARVEVLKNVARMGLDEFVVYGDDAKGYALLYVADYRVLQAQAREAERVMQDKAREKANAIPTTAAV